MDNVLNTTWVVWYPKTACQVWVLTETLLLWRRPEEDLRQVFFVKYWNVFMLLAASNWRYLTSCSLHVACCWNHDDSILMWQRYTCILLWLNLGSKSQMSWNTVFLTLMCKDSGGGFNSFKSGVNMFPKEDSFIFMVSVHCLGEEYNWKIKQNLITEIRY